MGKNIKKIGIGALIGLAFGVLAAFGFAGVTRVIDLVLPDRSQTEAKAEQEEDVSNAESEKVESTDSKASEKVKNTSETKAEATLTKAVADDKVERASQSQGMSVVDLAENNLPCVVSITNTTVQTLRDMWGNGVREFENVSRGSGIIIGQTDEELLIVTNSHVVNGADSITVGFADSEIYDASVKGEDTAVDLAVIGVKMSDIKKDTLNAIKVAVIGDSDALRVGEQVVAIGNAVGYGQSVTTGIVSALDRDVPDDDTDTHYIQTDAAINPGNSGGALINMKGEVIGINSAKLASTAIEGIGYAIPINYANPTIETLMNREQRDKVDEEKAGYLGITGVSVDTQTSKMYGIPEGIYLQEVVEDGPAAKAGLHKGDIIKKFEGITVTSIADLRSNLDCYEAGEEIELLYCRQENGEYVDKTVKVKLATAKDVGIENKKTDKDKQSPKDNEEGNEEDQEGADRDGRDDERNNGNNGYDQFNSLPDELREFFFGW
ncbi:MAG: trypsin-like peptidase domain-containing protein [Lachnospiraceae bacterium]|nr:trypsin-like peptidase domain-containing protein [Lachnospiraceae bacterium]